MDPELEGKGSLEYQTPMLDGDRPLLERGKKAKAKVSEPQKTVFTQTTTKVPDVETRVKSPDLDLGNHVV